MVISWCITEVSSAVAKFQYYAIILHWTFRLDDYRFLMFTCNLHTNIQVNTYIDVIVGFMGMHTLQKRF